MNYNVQQQPAASSEQSPGQEAGRNQGPRRGRRGKNQPAGTNPFNQGDATPRGLPQSNNLAKSHSAMQNDPLYKQAIVGEPEITMAPLADDPNIFSAADGLTPLIDELYNKAVSAKQGFSKRVPDSAFAAYCATLTYARLLAVHSHNGYPLSYDEREFLSEVKQGQFVIPNLLQIYLDGIGNITVPEGRELRFKLLRPHYVRGAFGNVAIPGFFDRVGPDTHFLYKSYPCLAVYFDRLLHDMAAHPGEEGDWDLPDNISPDDPEEPAPNPDDEQVIRRRDPVAHPDFPTENMLGYRTSSTLSSVMKSWLISEARVNVNRVSFDNESIAYSSSLMNAVCTELRQCDVFKLAVLDLQSANGSIGQLLSVAPVLTTVPEYESVMDATSLTKLSDVVTSLAGPFRYRSFHSTGPRARRNEHQAWCVYSFNDFLQVPEDWIETINMLRTEEYPELDYRRYRSPQFRPRLMIRRYVDNDSNARELFKG